MSSSPAYDAIAAHVAAATGSSSSSHQRSAAADPSGSGTEREVMVRRICIPLDEIDNRQNELPPKSRFFRLVVPSSSGPRSAAIAIADDEEELPTPEAMKVIDTLRRGGGCSRCTFPRPRPRRPQEAMIHHRHHFLHQAVVHDGVVPSSRLRMPRPRRAATVKRWRQPITSAVVIMWKQNDATDSSLGWRGHGVHAPRSLLWWTTSKRDSAARASPSTLAVGRGGTRRTLLLVGGP